MKDKEFVDIINTNFSSSDENIMYVKQLTTMCTLKQFFQYRVRLMGCGFPTITLTRTVEDWEKIVTNMKQLVKIDPNIEDMIPIMEKIAESKKGKVDKDFWREMLKREVNKEGR